jgi:hypothetical protein
MPDRTGSAHVEGWQPVGHFANLYCATITGWFGANLFFHEDFLDGAPSAMVLGDNIFFGHRLPEVLQSADERSGRELVFGYHVSDPERCGVVDFDADERVQSIIESQNAVKLCGRRPLFSWTELLRCRLKSRSAAA